MRKQDLETGMQVEQRNGCRKVVLLGTQDGDIIVDVGESGWGSLANYNDELIFITHPELDIIKVYESHYPHRGITNKYRDSELIWERPDTSIKITVEVNGKQTSLKEISEETLLNIRNNTE